MNEDLIKLQNMKWADLQKLGKRLNCPPLYLSHQVFQKRLVKVILVKSRIGSASTSAWNTSPKKSKRSSYLRKKTQKYLPESKDSGMSFDFSEKKFSSCSASPSTAQSPSFGIGEETSEGGKSFVDDTENSTAGHNLTTVPTVLIVQPRGWSSEKDSPVKNYNRSPRQVSGSPRTKLCKIKESDSTPKTCFVNMMHLWQQRDFRKSTKSLETHETVPVIRRTKSGKKSKKPKVMLVSEEDIKSNQITSCYLSPELNSELKQIAPSFKQLSFARYTTNRSYENKDSPQTKIYSEAKCKPKHKEHEDLVSFVTGDQDSMLLKTSSSPPRFEKRSLRGEKMLSQKKVTQETEHNPVAMLRSTFKTVAAIQTKPQSPKVESIKASTNEGLGCFPNSNLERMSKKFTKPLCKLQPIYSNELLVNEDIKEFTEANIFANQMENVFSSADIPSSHNQAKSNAEIVLPDLSLNKVLSTESKQNFPKSSTFSELNPTVTANDTPNIDDCEKEKPRHRRKISKRLPIFKPTPVETELVKPVLRDFDLLKQIGRGAFGKVYQVKHIKSQKIYAMKVLIKRKLVERNQVEHTKTERWVLQLSQHPFCVTLRFAFQNSKKLYLVMDFYRGGELFVHLQKMRRFKEVTVRLMIAEITLALGHLHKHGVIYRDLKAENVLIDQDGHIALTDFGLSKRLKPGEAARTLCGTPEYLAPEIVMGVGHDKNVDWWSVGILCYELVVGIPPFYSQNLNQLYQKIKYQKLSWRRRSKYLSKEIMDFVKHLLDRNPKTRLGAGEEDVNELLSHDFFYSLDFKKVLAKEVKPIYKPSFEGGRNDLLDTSNFETEKVRETYIDESEFSIADEPNYFEHFTYKPDTILGGVV